MEIVGYQTPYSATDQSKIAEEIKWGKKTSGNFDKFAFLPPVFPNLVGRHPPFLETRHGGNGNMENT